MKNLSPINDNKDVVTKEYVDSKVAFYDGRVHRSTNTDTTNCWVKIAECEAPNSTAQIMEEITLYPNTIDSAVKTMCKVRVEGKGAYASTWKLHIIDSTKDFNSNKVKLIYDKNIVDDKRKIELWGYNINGWDGFYSQKTFRNKDTLTHGLKCLTSQDKFKTTYLHDDFVEAPTIDISIKSLVNEGLTSLENDIALNRTTLGTQCKNLLKNNAVTQTVSGVTFTVNSDGSVTVNGTNTSSSSAYIQLCGLVNYGNSKLIASIGQNITDVYMAIYDSDWNWIGTGSAGTISWENSSKKRLVRLVVKPGATINNVTVYPMLRYADITDDTYEEYHETVDERILENKSDIVINKTTLGYQRKNLFDWKNANVDNSSNATYTKTDTDITVTSTGAWGRVAYKLPNLEIDTKYTFFAAVSDLSQAAATTRIRIAYNPEGTNKIIDINLTEDGKYKADFTPTESTVYVLFYPNFSANIYTNSFTASDIMLRYADIIDDTYEAYQPSVQEQTPYSISVSGKSTSAAISYSGVPTLICLTPNTADSTAGGLYMINSAGSVVKLIEKTGVVVAAASSSKTFTITNNTSTVMDVCISRCWGR